MFVKSLRFRLSFVGFKLTRVFYKFPLCAFKMADVAVRDAEPSDCKLILQMIKELAVFEDEPESRVNLTAEILQEDGFSSDKWFYSLVAEVEVNKEKLVIGYALFFRTYSTWDGRSMKIEDLYVKPEYRKLGVGRKLLQEVTARALEHKCIRVHWCILAENEPAIKFYEKLGGEIQHEWKVCYLVEEKMKALVK